MNVFVIVFLLTNVQYFFAEDTSFNSISTDGCSCVYSQENLITCHGNENCIGRPNGISMQEVNLTIIRSNIKRIVKENFLNHAQLLYLTIDSNPHLEELEPGCFERLTNLVTLTITQNPNLQVIHEETFNGLINLEELNLVNNGLSNIKKLAISLSPTFLPKLMKLTLNDNQFYTINKNDLLSMTRSPVEELCLINCQINFIHPESLLALKNLQKLRIGENNFSIDVVTNLLNEMVKQKIPLMKLYLSNNQLESLPTNFLTTAGNLKLRTLSIKRNRIGILKNNSFIPMNKLTVLDLKESEISGIDSNAFMGMPNLDQLLLDSNKLAVIPEGTLLPQLSFLDLSSNYITSLGSNKFLNMSNLWDFNLNNNNIQIIYNQTFNGLTNLMTLRLQNNSLIKFEEGTFKALGKLSFLDLENNPKLELTKNTFVGLKRLEVLSLAGCSFSTFDPNNNPFKVLTMLNTVYLNRNNIAVISPHFFNPLTTLSTVHLHDNNLTSWKEQLFSKLAIEEMNLSNNNITLISKAMLQDFSKLEILHLYNNPFICNCEMVTAISNVLMHRLLLKDEELFCNFPDNYKNTTVLKYYEKFNNSNFCEEIHPMIIVLFVITIILIFIVLFYRYRFHVQYWIFLMKIEFIRKRKLFLCTETTAIEMNSDKNIFDAFVSYSNEDRNFVVQMVGMLENYEPYLKLCVYERDFRIGGVICDNVLESVEKSRKMILILSNAYIKSHWCRWEAQVAENYRLFFQNEHGALTNDSIVVIKLEQVDKSNMTPMLNYLLKTRVYLQWDSDKDKQKEFWKKLRNYLTPPCKLDVIKK